MNDLKLFIEDNDGGNLQVNDISSPSLQVENLPIGGSNDNLVVHVNGLESDYYFGAINLAWSTGRIIFAVDENNKVFQLKEKDSISFTFSRMHISADENNVLEELICIGDHSVLRRLKSHGVAPFNTLIKIEDYAYYAEYSDLNYQYANEYFRNGGHPYIPGGCSAVVKDGIVGKNFDWLYSNMAEFVVHVPGNELRYASYGLCGQLKELTNSFVESRTYSDAYRILPFMVTDGINSKGLFVGTNVVPKDYGETTGSIPTEEIRDIICSLMLPRYILDRFATVDEACSYLLKHVSVYCPDSLHSMGYEQHFILADSNRTVCIEFINNFMLILDITSKPIVTNFFLNNVAFTYSGLVYTPESQSGSLTPMRFNHITENGSGLERYNLLASEYEYMSVEDLMLSVRYSNAYNPNMNPYWYTEFVGNGLTVDSSIYQYQQSGVIEAAQQAWSERSRYTEKVWHTVHTSVYNLSERKLKLIFQEGTVKHEFAMDDYTREDIDELLSRKVDKIAGKGLSSNDLTDSLIDRWNGKQNLITDLDAIRRGASRGYTALQPDVLDNYRPLNQQDKIDRTKVDKIPGMGLSSNDFTNSLKEKLEQISLDGYATEDYVDESIDIHNNSEGSHPDIREIAAGRTKNYVCSAITNPQLNSLADIIELTSSLIDISGNEIAIDDLKPGDNIYISELTVYDRWYAGNGLLYRLETAKVPVNDVQFKNASVIVNGVAHIPSSLSSFTDDSTHRTVSDTEKSTWNGKQAAISDLATIRSNASAGAAKVSCTDETVGSFGYIKMNDLPVWDGGVTVVN